MIFPFKLRSKLRLTNRDIKWAELADTLNARSSLILLDGYDELLQASGKVFSGYLKSVQKFQENELALKRKPVRTIVTSRITLIDKADIPQGATIIRLQPFNEEQRKIWARIWNRINRQYFNLSGVHPFILPHKGKLKELAEQPLLLLMLALYDSESNQLHQAEDLEQTLLYDSLLRRFILRERAKSQSFDNLDSNRKNQEIDRDLERLAVAAMGMFNRRSLNIKIGELNQDLKFFRLERKLDDDSSAILTQAELLLGSFFFVHESSSSHKTETTEKGKDTAFEFLHNTFGEFLTAEFMLHKIIKVCDDLDVLQKVGKNEFRETTLNEPDKFPVECFAYAPLYSRPVILEMMREWLPYKLKRQELSEESFIRELDALITRQISFLITSNKLPSLMTTGLENNPYNKLPTMGHMAIYSLNLILLATVLAQKEYHFDEERILPSEDGQRAWDRLTHLWRSWFSIENLNGLSAVLDANRTKNIVILQAKQVFNKSSTSNKRLDLILNVASSLADNVLAGLSGYFADDAPEQHISKLQEIQLLLANENINLEFEVLSKQVNLLTQHVWKSSFVQQIYEHVVRIRDPRELPPYLLENIIKLAKQLRDSRYIETTYHNVIRRTDPRDFSAGMLTEAFKLASTFRDSAFARELFERVITRRDAQELFPDVIVEAIKFAIQSGDRDYLQYMYYRVIKKFSPRKLSPELFIEAIRLAKYLDDKDYLLDIYERIFRKRDPRKIPIQLLEPAIWLAKQLDDHNYIQNIYENVIRNIHPLEIPPTLFIEVIGLAKDFNDETFSRELFERIFLKSNLRELPYSYLLGGVILATQFGNVELAREMYEYATQKRYPRELAPELIAEAINLARQFYYIDYFGFDYMLMSKQMPLFESDNFGFGYHSPKGIQKIAFGINNPKNE